MRSTRKINADAVRLAICAPVFNEEDGVQTFLSAVDQAVEALHQLYPQVDATVLLVDDGSRDKTVEKACQFQLQHARALEIHSLSRNFGHAAAVSALLDLALNYDVALLLDADMQDDPSVLPQLYSHWANGFEAVRIVRAKRNEGLLFSILSKTFYRLFKKLSNLESGIGNFGLYDHKVVSAATQYPERVRYWPGIITLAGYPTQLVTLDRNARTHGESRVGMKGLIRLAMVALFSFSTVPIQLMGLFGMGVAAVSAVAAFAVVILRVGFGMGIPGWASFLTAQFFFGGLIIFCLGVVGQYVGIIFEEVKARPRYFIKDRRTVEAQQTKSKAA